MVPTPPFFVALVVGVSGGTDDHVDEGGGGKDKVFEVILQNCCARVSAVCRFSGQVIATQYVVAFANSCCPQ